jgi:ribosomal protein S27AE
MVEAEPVASHGYRRMLCPKCGTAAHMFPLLNDGGSLQQCGRCHATVRALRQVPRPVNAGS